MDHLHFSLRTLALISPGDSDPDPDEALRRARAPRTAAAR